MISNEDMIILDGFEHTFHTAIENNYARHFGSKQYNMLNAIYERITGKKYSVNYGCSYCALGFVKALAKLYFAEKARQESEKSAENNQQVQTELEPKPVSDSKPKGKGGRPKKTATNK